MIRNLLLSTFGFLLTCLATAQSISKEPFQEGDFLFLNLDCGPLCDAIEEVTLGYNNFKFSHIGMLVEQNKQLRVLEAIGKNVRTISVDSFIAYSKHNGLHARLKPQWTSLIPQAVHFGMSKIGEPYDDVFLTNNGKWYCSELLYEAFLHANKSKPVFSLEPMTFKKPGTNDFFPAWKEYYNKLGQPIPEGLPGCNPGGFSRSEHIVILGWK